ncbi:MAG TPA: UDP-N-acetylmuramoyl-L-alanyl-D-glutamate--2,6-diaminopimelate ligase [Patescibacteria group bacterium]|nr:UDP-N-acetylmuramoyl-L-alanyl-D-glutamate--2,6-diaminopimelate ligase [Patescibacteria group bacterium]
MELKEVLREVPDVRVAGDPRTTVRGLAYDSRAVEPGYLFAAIKGERRDGFAYLDQALERGAAAFLTSRPPDARAARAAWVQVADDRLGLALASRNYYGRPDERMTMIGVTGTNGKTTTCHLLEAGLREAGLKPCLLGTVGHRYGREELKADRTTPESLDLYRHLDRFATAGARSCAMEVSSHALALRRAAGIRFRAAVFTNLTQDHLDFHGTMEAYLDAKAILFRDLAPDAVAVLNADDTACASLRRTTRARVVTWGQAPDADVRIDRSQISIDGTEIALAVAPGVEPAGAPGGAAPLVLRSPLLGVPNARNLTAAAAALLAVGVPRDAVTRGLGAVTGVPGRFERVDAGQSFLVLVDYAHTDDALSNVLRTVRALGPRRVVTVFGCGGDRDRAKRPLMGFAAASLSDVVVVTSDNPRSEEPRAILEEILPGVRRALGIAEGATPPPERCLVMVDRREAIRRAIGLARAGDCVVIAGKGHETYQILGDRTVPFDDRQVAREALGGSVGPVGGRAA